MVVIAGDEHDLTTRKRTAQPLEERAGGGERIAARTVAQLEHVAEQHEAVDPLERREQDGARLGVSEHVDARGAAEVEI